MLGGLRSCVGLAESPCWYSWLAGCFVVALHNHRNSVSQTVSEKSRFLRSYIRMGYPSVFSSVPCEALKAWGPISSDEARYDEFGGCIEVDIIIWDFCTSRFMVFDEELYFISKRENFVLGLGFK